MTKDQELAIKQRSENLLQAMKDKFPSITGLKLISDVGVFTFEEDKYHTQERIEAYYRSIRQKRI